MFGPGTGLASPFGTNTAEDRIHDLEQQPERLRAEMDEARQNFRQLRMLLDQASTGDKAKRGTASAR